MTDPATSERIVDVLQRFYRDPARYRSQMLHAATRFGNLNLVLRLALGRPVESFDSAPAGSDAAAQLERAAVFFVQHIFFRDDASHYEILGLQPEAEPDAIRENFRLLMQLIHPDRHSYDTAWPENFAARANRAYTVLKNGEARAAYDQQQHEALHKADAAQRAAASGL